VLVQPGDPEHLLDGRGQAAQHQRYQPAGGIWERYVYGPESNPDPATWRTELNQPVAG